jgi:hypothetical protein
MVWKERQTYVVGSFIKYNVGGPVLVLEKTASFSRFTPFTI